MTVLLSFEEKTDDARACALSGHCLFNRKINFLSFNHDLVAPIFVLTANKQPHEDTRLQGGSLIKPCAKVPK